MCPPCSTENATERRGERAELSGGREVPEAPRVGLWLSCGCLCPWGKGRGMGGLRPLVQGLGSHGGWFLRRHHSLRKFFCLWALHDHRYLMQVAVPRYTLGLLLIASQLGGDGYPPAWGVVHPALTSAWCGSSLHGHLALPCLTLYLSYSQLCFLLHQQFVLFFRDSALLSSAGGGDFVCSGLHLFTYFYFYILFEHIFSWIHYCHSEPKSHLCLTKTHHLRKYITKWKIYSNALSGLLTLSMK